MDFGPPSKTGEENILSHLGRLLNDQIKTDVEFVVKGQKVGGHQLILQGGSPVFAAMFEHEMVESVTRTVTIEDTEPKVFSQLLRYLYTGDAPEIEDSEMTEPLFIAADKYQVDSLKDWCVTVLASRLSLKSAVSTLVLAHLHSCEELVKKCVTFISQNKSAIWSQPEFKTLCKSYPDLFFMVTKSMFKSAGIL